MWIRSTIGDDNHARDTPRHVMPAPIAPSAPAELKQNLGSARGHLFLVPRWKKRRPSLSCPRACPQFKIHLYRHGAFVPGASRTPVSSYETPIWMATTPSKALILLTAANLALQGRSPRYS